MNNQKNNSSQKGILKWIKPIAYLETISFLVLLCIAMPLKYVMGKPEAVQIVGMAHGVLFVLYVALLGMGFLKKKYTFGEALLGVAASFLPIGPIVFHKKVG